MKKTNKKLVLTCLAGALLATTASGFALTKTISTQAAGETRVFTMVDGAFMRVTDPTGIRFKAKMDAQYGEELTKDNATAKLHVAVIPYSYYEAYQEADTQDALYPWLSAEYGAENILDLEVPAEKIYTETEDTVTYYYANAVMSNVYFNNYNVNFVGVAYIQDGTTYQDVTDITEEENARSIFEVAYKAASDPTEYAKHGQFLDQVMEKGMYNAYGVTYDKATEKYSYNGDTYDTYTEMENALDVDVMDCELSIGSTTANLLMGDTKQLTPVLKFADGTTYSKPLKYEWSSSNESVATVDENGKVTPVKPGATNITVSVFGGKKYETACALTVLDTNLFASTSNWTFNPGYTGLSWNSTDETWVSTQKHAEISYDWDYFYTSIEPLERMVELGQQYAKFSVKADADFLTNAPAIGVYANCLAGGNPASARPKDTIGNAYALTVETLTTTEWTEIYLDLTKMATIAATNGADLSTFTIATGGAVGSVVEFKDFKAVTQEEYDAEQTRKQNEAYKTVDVFGSTANVIRWKGNHNATWDATEQAWMFTKSYSGHDHVLNRHTNTWYIDIGILKEMVKLEYTTMSFKIKADEAFVNNTGNRKVAIRAVNGSNESTIEDPWNLCDIITMTVANEWVEIDVDLTKIAQIQTAQASYGEITGLAVTMGGAQGSHIWIKEFKYKAQ